MKGRLSAAIICIAAAFLMSVGSEMYIVRKCAMLIEGLDKSLCAESGSVEMYDAALEACEEWDGCETLFGSLLKHSDADDLDHAYSLIREYAACSLTAQVLIRFIPPLLIREYVGSKDIDELKETLEECKVTVKVIADGEKPRAENIF